MAKSTTPLVTLTFNRSDRCMRSFHKSITHKADLIAANT